MAQQRTNRAEQSSTLAERFPDLEVLSVSPENAQIARRDVYKHFLTPREHHYVRNHYPTPWIDEDVWTVSLTGLVDEELELSVDTIKHDYPTASVGHTMTCSGNGRAAFEPTAGDLQWSFGPLGTAVWTGTPVRDILVDCGADMNDGLWLSVMGGDAPEGEDVFCRSIPMWKITESCLLAYEMNGKPLRRDHGYPVRLVVPGWYGNNSVKWVERMHVMETMVYGDKWENTGEGRYTRWQQNAYRLVPKQDGAAKHYRSIDVFDLRDQMDASSHIRNAYLYDQVVNSLITHPSEETTTTPDDNDTVDIEGVAWAGDDAVERVEISIDGGSTWNEAELFAPALGPYAWRRFRYEWDVEPGEYTIVSRATDEKERTQPATISAPEEGLRETTNGKYPWNRDGYGSNAYTSHAVKTVIN